MRKKRPGRKYKRTKENFGVNQEACYARAGGKCEVTGARLYVIRHYPGCDGFGECKCKRTRKWACHHIISERFVRLHFKKVNPHMLENLCAIVVTLHSRITAAEMKLYKADWLGYRTELNRLGFPLELLDRAWRALCQAEGKTSR